MSDERRYDDEEVRRIFDAAAEARESAVTGSRASEHGLTLAELQDIGREVGLTPERIQQAAAALDRPAPPPARRTVLGLPLSVGRVVDLPRAPTDREWEWLVAELRQTFQAKGRVEEYGRIRGWTNSNLHAYVEPTEGGGYQLRLGTRKGNAMPRVLVGAFFLVMAMFVFFAGDAGAAPILAAMGAGALGSVVVGQPRWARLREKQMAYIEGRARELLAAGPGNDS